MQTFLPYSDFAESAACLDYKRLGKQRVEAYQILRILLGITPKARWKNHPAVLMWKGYELSLWNYTIQICNEWIKRGYKDSIKAKLIDIMALCWKIDASNNNWPEWLGNRDFHKSHQSNLVRKLPEHYKKYFPKVPNDLLYYWPTKDNSAFYELRRVV